MSALVTNIQGYSIHDGPGIRTVVFLKGCGLECRWCSNPECISPKPDISLFKSLCTKCGKCAEVCPEKALDLETDKTPRIDRKRCSGCGRCASACYYQALVLNGRQMSVETVFDAVKRDSLFYQASGGGVTVSGGEVLLHPQFVTSLLEICRRDGIHTCIETSGFGPESALQQMLPFLDYVLFDLKLMNSSKHHQYTGQINELILANARTVAQSRPEFLFRMPLIPGVNDDQENIRETAEFLHELGQRAARIELMPYHRLGTGKYESLDMTYQMAELTAPDSDRVERVKKAFQELGIACSISR